MPIIPGPPPAGSDWTEESWKAFWSVLADPLDAIAKRKTVGDVAGVALGTEFTSKKAKVNPALETIQTSYTTLESVALAPVVQLVNLILGAGIPVDIFQNLAASRDQQASKAAYGEEIRKLIFNIFETEELKQDYLSRVPKNAGKNNFARFIGTNILVQTRNMIAGSIAKVTPWNLAEPLEEVAERCEKLLGLEDAQEEIMEPLMEFMIIEPLKQLFNKQYKPVDLTPSDALKAKIQGLISPAELSLILDNAGIRDDVREALEQMAGKNWTESDLSDLYHRGHFTREQVKDAFRNNTWTEEDAEWKTVLVEGDRRWKLTAELLNCKEAQFIAGVIDEASFRTFVHGMGYTSLEEELEVEICKCKMTIKPGAKPKQITGSFNVTPERVKPGATAIMKWNIRNADSVFIEGVGNVEPRGEVVITPAVSATYYLTAKSDTDEERFPAVVIVGDTKEVRLPTATLTVSPSRGTIGQPRELRWRTSGADSVFLEGFGIVEPAGLRVVMPILPTFYTLRATNQAGTTEAQDVAFVSLPSIPELERNQPKVSFAITPGVVSLAQAQSELKWIIENSDDQWLIAPDGTREKIPAQGVRIITSLASGVWEVEAQNQFGKTSRQEAVIFKGTQNPETAV